MGKRTLRTLHFDLVAAIMAEARQHTCNEWDSAFNAIEWTARRFADEFEIRAEGFQREKFLRQCGLEGK